MRVKLQLPAPDHERYTKEQADSMVGKATEFNGRPATVVKAQRTKDGRAINFTLEVDRTEDGS